MPTRRFGLSDTVDNAVIDAVLAALETHEHTGGERLADPIEAPSGVLSRIGGLLPGSSTFYYRYSLLDRFGFETAASQEFAVSTPKILEAPSAPEPQLTLTGAGGSLTPGTYLYYFTTLGEDAEETPLSAPGQITLVAGDPGSVTVPAPDQDDEGVIGWQLWRQAPGESAPTRLGVYDLDDEEQVDNGSIPAEACACDPDYLPRQFNGTNSTNRVLLELPSVLAGALADPSQVSAWRVYRATTPGGYSASSLLAEVVTRDEDGALVANFTDDGLSGLALGRPLDVGRTLFPSVKIASGGGGGKVANPILTASNGSTWGIGVSPHGLLTTTADATYGTAYNIGYGPILTAVGGGLWLLDVNARGDLSTTALEPAGVTVEDTVFATDEGPLLVLGRGRRYRLGVHVSGDLILTALDEETS